MNANGAEHYSRNDTTDKSTAAKPVPTKPKHYKTHTINSDGGTRTKTEYTRQESEPIPSVNTDKPISIKNKK